MKKIFFLLALFCVDISANDLDSLVSRPYYSIEKGDSFFSIAKKFDISVDELKRANPAITDLTKINHGYEMLLPLNHILPNRYKGDGIIINISEPRLYYFSKKSNSIKSFPVTIGADDKKTPLGKTLIYSKKYKPNWTPTDSIKKENPDLPDVIEAGPDNPLGEYAIKLDSSKNKKWQNIMIHSTNKPWGIGVPNSHGCMRLYPQDMEELFDEVENGIEVRIVRHPVKVLVDNDKVFLELHLDDTKTFANNFSDTKNVICKYYSDCENKIDWLIVEGAVRSNDGVPVIIR